MPPEVDQTDPLTPAQVPEPPEGAGGGEEEKWLLPGVYKSADDAVKAAEEGKRKISELGQQASALQNELSQYQAWYQQTQGQPPAEGEPPGGDDDFVTAKSLKKMLQEELGRALEPLAKTVGRTTLTAMKQEISADPDYPTLKDEFEVYTRLLPPQALSDPEAIRLAYNAVKGQNFEKVFQARQARQPATRLPGEVVLGRVAGRSGAPLSTTGEPVSPEAKRASAMLGVESEAELAKWSDPNYFGEPSKEGNNA